jgi:hypothetical protein
VTPTLLSSTDFQARFAGDPSDLPSKSRIVTVTVVKP